MMPSTAEIIITAAAITIIMTYTETGIFPVGGLPSKNNIIHLG